MAHPELGAEKILAQDPETRPETLDRSPAPFVHAATRKIRKELPTAKRRRSSTF